MNTNFIRLQIFAALLATTLPGCGGGGSDQWTERRPPTYPVTGTVTYKGQPVEGAGVSFRVPGQPGASAITDGDGKFTLRTFEPADGAVAGTHDVKVTKFEVVGEDPSYGDPSSPNYGKEPPPEARGETKNLLPEKYSTYELSDIVVQVKEQENIVTIELTD